MTLMVSTAMAEGDRDGLHLGEMGLTEKQAKFVRALVSGIPQVKAATIAGYSSPDTQSSRLVRTKSVQEAIRVESGKVLLSEGVPAALSFMIKAPGNEKLPGAVRFQAAKWVMEAAGHGLAAQRAALGLPGDDTPLDQMSPAALEEFLKAGLGAMEQLRAQRARTIDHGARNDGSDPMAAPMQVADFIDVDVGAPLSE